MKITKKLLGQVINEELSRVLREAGQDYIEEPSAEAGLGEADLQSEVERGMAAGAANPMDIPEELLGDIGDIEAAKQKLLSLLSTNISEGRGRTKTIRLASRPPVRHSPQAMETSGVGSPRSCTICL